MLTQAEIDALLNGSPAPVSNIEEDDDLSPLEKDALGEIGNISMGTSATTLFTLLGQKVNITTPQVSVTSWEQMAKDYPKPYVGVKVEYTHGLIGSNLLILQDKDVKIITDLMMGGDGTNTAGELSDLHLSAIGEAMNQMIGSSATSMSSMFEKKIDISPPKSFVIEFNTDQSYRELDDSSQKFVKISFKMIVGELIDSEIMQILPINFARSLVENLLNANKEAESHKNVEKPKEVERPVQQAERPQPQRVEEPHRMMYEEPDYGYSRPQQQNRPPVNVQSAQFQDFNDYRPVYDKKNIDLIMDVPLQVTVELGRTHKQIRDILEFGQGSIIELDKLAGEPVDILVNGKGIAKGEVVVIDESFGVRITDIIHPSKRL